MNKLSLTTKNPETVARKNNQKDQLLKNYRNSLKNSYRACKTCLKKSLRK